MAAENLRVSVRDNWTIEAIGLERERGGSKPLVGSLILKNGHTVYVGRESLDEAEGRRRFAEAATAHDRPTADEIEAAILDRLPDALALVHGAEPKPSQADGLVALAQDVELFHDRDGEAYATIDMGECTARRISSRRRVFVAGLLGSFTNRTAKRRDHKRCRMRFSA